MNEPFHTLEVYDEITGCYFVASCPGIGEYEPATVEVAHEIAATKFPGKAYRIVSTITVYPEDQNAA